MKLIDQQPQQDERTEERVAFPAGILRNAKTGRFHPVFFYTSLMPTEEPQRYGQHLAKGHHEEGFDSYQDAAYFIRAHPSSSDTRMTWDWDGVTVPALTYVSISGGESR